MTSNNDPIEGLVGRLKTDTEHRVNWIKYHGPGATGNISEDVFKEQAIATLLQLPLSGRALVSPRKASSEDWKNLAGLWVMYLEFKESSDERGARIQEVFGMFGWGEHDWDYAPPEHVWRFLENGYLEALVSEEHVKFSVSDQSVPRELRQKHL